MLIRLKKRRKKDDFTYFLQFLTVFTGIFMVMTVIILQVMRVGMYSSVDKKLVYTAKNVESFVPWIMATEVEQTESIYIDRETFFKTVPTQNLAANTDFLFYDENGQILNGIANLTSLGTLKFQKQKLNTLYVDKSTSKEGPNETYHLFTVKVSNPLYPNLKYATVVVNVTQIEETTLHYSNIIVTAMLIFWCLSVGASVYLARWSVKPILENYERQKMFVENASHELRTPLTVLQNRLEQLFRKPNATIMENSESIVASLEEVRNMRILTSNLLNLARRDDGIKLELTTINSDFFEDLFENYALVAEENDRKFTSKSEITSSFSCDPNLLKQLLTILFDNAMKYTEVEGSIDIVVKTQEKHLLIFVSDDGIGISEKDKLRVFDRFYRVDKSRTRKRGGFGLGLALAKQIVDILHGRIKIIDRKPKGTIFEIKL